MHPVNAQGVSGLLEFLLAGFLFIPSVGVKTGGSRVGGPELCV